MIVVLPHGPYDAREFTYVFATQHIWESGPYEGVVLACEGCTNPHNDRRYAHEGA